MAITNNNLPLTAITTPVGTTSVVAWTNPTYVELDDTNTADTSPAKNEVSDWLRVTNFNFSIPPTATINGIEVEIKHFATYGNNIIHDNAVYLRKTSGQVGGNYASGNLWSGDDIEVFYYGGQNDLWGTSLNVADINSVDFGLDIDILNTGADALTDSIYYVKIKIYYCLGTNMQINIEGVWKSVNGVQINIGGVWKTAVCIQQNIGGVWKTY